MRQCGECTLCCTLLGVHALNKPPLETCRHCDNGLLGRGCKIYNIRPNECKEFDCEWLAGRIPENLNPDITHVVLADLAEAAKHTGLNIVEETVVVYTDPNYPDAYKQGVMQDYLNNLLAKGIALIVVKNGQKRYMKHGTIDFEEFKETPSSK